MSEKVTTLVPTELGGQGPRLTQPVRITEHAWPEGTIPVVSIVSLAYNHEKFIRKCFEGFLMQETTFPVEILIHDDASTDSTANIIREYEAQYPHIIKPIFQTENQCSKGKFVDVFTDLLRAKGKYIALCEGDDYWTSGQKLERQVELLDNNPEYTMCFHNVEVLGKDGGGVTQYYNSSNQKEIVRLDDLWEYNISATCSMMLRRCNCDELPSWFGDLPYGDWTLQVICAQQGALGYLSECMGTYRVHSGGVWSRLNETQQLEKMIEWYEKMNANLDFRHSGRIRPMLARYSYELAERFERSGELDRAKAYAIKSVLDSPVNRVMPAGNRYKMLLRLCAPGLYKKIRNAKRRIVSMAASLWRWVADL